MFSDPVLFEMSVAAGWVFPWLGSSGAQILLLALFALGGLLCVISWVRDIFRTPRGTDEAPDPRGTMDEAPGLEHMSKKAMLAHAESTGVTIPPAMKRQPKNIIALYIDAAATGGTRRTPCAAARPPLVVVLSLVAVTVGTLVWYTHAPTLSPHCQRLHDQIVAHSPVRQWPTPMELTPECAESSCDLLRLVRAVHVHLSGLDRVGQAEAEVDADATLNQVAAKLGVGAPDATTFASAMAFCQRPLFWWSFFV